MSVYPVCSLIRELRKRNKITQASLCYNLCEISTLSRIETGLLLPSTQLAECLMQRLKAQEYFYIGNSTLGEIDFLKRQTKVLREMENDDFESYHAYTRDVPDCDDLGKYEKQRHLFMVACYNEKTGDGDVDDYIEALQVTLPLDYVLGHGKRPLYFDQELLILLSIVRLFAYDGANAVAKKILGRLYEFTKDDHYLYPVICHYVTCINYGTAEKMIPEIVPRD